MACRSGLQGKCFLRVESYWSYEFCFGRHIRQFHDENQGLNQKSEKPAATQYYLGRKVSSNIYFNVKIPKTLPK